MSDAPDQLPIFPAAVSVSDPWLRLRRFTSARIALGRTGGSQRMETVLDFRLSHARARDAVMAPFDLVGVETRLAAAGLATHRLATGVTDKKTFLVRPDLGRNLDVASASNLAALAPAWGPRDLAIVISDGLAAQAAERHAVATVTHLTEHLTAAGWSLYPIFLVPFGRVKLQDEIGERLGARFTLMLLGERPGLGMPDSLGAYFTSGPAASRTDADRNCVSNIRPEGLPPAAAATKLAWLLIESARTGRAGVALKDGQPAFSPVGELDTGRSGN